MPIMMWLEIFTVAILSNCLPCSRHWHFYTIHIHTLIRRPTLQLLLLLLLLLLLMS